MRLGLRLRTILSGGVLTAALSIPASAAAEVIATESRSTPITALGDAIAWSSLDPQTGRWHLKFHDRRGTRILPVRSRAIPFDVDLGVARDGSLRLLYSRCERETPVSGVYSRGRGCRIYEFDFERERETRIATGVLPSRWRGRLAFSTTQTDPDRRAGIRLMDLRTRRARDLDEGPQGVLGTSPRAIDLSARHVAYLWRTRPEACTEDPEDDQPEALELRVMKIGHPSRRVTRLCSPKPGVITHTFSLRGSTLTSLQMTVPRLYTDGERVTRIVDHDLDPFRRLGAVEVPNCTFGAVRASSRTVVTMATATCRDGDAGPVVIERRTLTG